LFFPVVKGCVLLGPAAGREWAAQKLVGVLAAADEQDTAWRVYGTGRRITQIASSILLFVLTTQAATLNSIRQDSHSQWRDARRGSTLHVDRDVRLSPQPYSLFYAA
jgi:hypothetical protein